ncbi:response regulator transcription factor [Limobrevibacterium gyesilva]|uniref:Response regulator transcription factor n=1 Tax=Limobrevibacterium gyesilva TaxID=2991712 RepID=A0AA41YJ77_9PROT|nr:response regulator transcription factor [Limobrevibacterium gyesilva]MCW3473216.1 response regulator transcription factor [Limobrevibacterium gyesilva]
MAQARDVLIVTGDGAGSGPVAEALQHGGAFRVTIAAPMGGPGPGLSAMVPTTHVDAVLLHVAHPSAVVPEMLSELGRSGLRAPVIILAEAGSEPDVVLGLDSGASDYMVGPLRPAELKARLRAQIRAHQASEDAVLAIGPYVFRPATRSLAAPAGGRHVRLTYKEAAILKYLYHAAGRPVARQTLLREVWGYSEDTDSETVESTVYRLRRKIEPDSSEARLLVNEAGGYRLRNNLSAWRD